MVLTLHDIIPISQQTNRNSSRQNSKLPQRNRRLGLGRITSRPSRVNDSPRTNRVTNIIGAMGKRSSASGENLNKRVGMLDLVGILLGVGIHAGHALAVRGASDAGLRGVDVVVHAVEGAADNHGGDTS